jgi:GT2 family glycosyltransferase
MTTVTIVTPWLAHDDLWLDYEQAIQVGGPDELIIVDNGTTPPLAFAQMRLQTNTGFSHACNIGLDAATSDAVLFLNNDIADAQPGWLDDIRQSLEPGVLVGPLRHDRHTEVDGRIVPYLDGWCLAGMRADLLDLGGFDETLVEPAYYSDNLLCLEARAAGMTLREVQPRLRHKGSATARARPWADAQAAAVANRQRYQKRYHELCGEQAALYQPRPEVVGAEH